MILGFILCFKCHIMALLIVIGENLNYDVTVQIDCMHIIGSMRKFKRLLIKPVKNLLLQFFIYFLSASSSRSLLLVFYHIGKIYIYIAAFLSSRTFVRPYYCCTNNEFPPLLLQILPAFANRPVARSKIATYIRLGMTLTVTHS